MKKIPAIVLSLGLLLNLAGCMLPAERTEIPETGFNTNSVGETTDSTTGANADSFEQLPMTAVSIPTVTQTETADDGTVIFRYTYQNISLILPDPDVADRVIVDFLNRIDEASAQAAQILDAAKSAYPGSAQWTPYLCQITYNPMRIDPGVLSLMGCYASYSGTPHPETTYLSVNYDLVTGSVLTFDDILSKSSCADTLYPLIIDALDKQKDEKSLYSGYESTVKERFNPNTDSIDNWYFSQTGLCFYFSPYEIAPYASGVVIAEIPYSRLTGILDDAYFPNEIENSSGSVTVVPLDDTDLENYTQFSEVVLDSSNNRILLHTQGSVYNIRIETGTWAADGTEFTPKHTVFAAYSLTPGDAIMIESDMPNTTPNLRLSYTVAEEFSSYYIISRNTAGDPELKEIP